MPALSAEMIGVVIAAARGSHKVQRKGCRLWERRVAAIPRCPRSNGKSGLILTPRGAGSILASQFHRSRM